MSIFNFWKKKEPPPPRPTCGAVIAAGGSSSRMGGEDKLFLSLCGIPIIAHALLAFERAESIDEIVIVTRSESIADIGAICREISTSKVKKIISGGNSRGESVRKGLLELSEDLNFVAIHDAARPLVTPELVDSVVRDAYEYGASVPVLPIKDTIKETSDGFVKNTPQRDKFTSVQTPQVFRRLELLEANERADISLATDDSSIMELSGVSVHTCPGSYSNIKITTPEDLALAQILLGMTGARL